MAEPSPTILFAGGGTGGHIYPNLAVLERLREDMGERVRGHFLVSAREVDADILDAAAQPFTPLDAQPLVNRPMALWQCLGAYRRSLEQVRRIITETRAVAMVGTGGFVTAPALHAARQKGLPAALVNLDAVPGLASRWSARHATDRFTAYRHPKLRYAQPIGLPLRRAALAEVSAEEARRRLGLSANRPTLLVTAGSQGAASINRAMAELSRRPAMRRALAQWQVLHLAGQLAQPLLSAGASDASAEHSPEFGAGRDELALAYAAAEVPAVVLTFCHEMGLAWAAADLAISRAGAGSVAEAWANGVPTIFLPYPYHRDQHQRLNAQPMVDTGGAILLDDQIQATRNATALAGPLAELLTERQRLEEMRRRLGKPPIDGAEIVAAWLRLAVEGA